MINKLQNNEAVISGKIVSVQTCWLNDDGSIYANIGLKRDIGTDWCRFTFHDGRITAEPSTSKDFDHIPLERFRNFVIANISDVLTLVTNLLEPDELKAITPNTLQCQFVNLS